MTGKKSKSDLVKIGLDGVDITAEINETGPTPLIDFSGIKTKAVKPKSLIESKMHIIVDKLISINPDGFLTRDEIIRLAEIPEEDLSRLVRRVQSYLRRDGQYVLQRAKKNGVYQYYVIRYS